MHKFEFEAIGTYWSIETKNELSYQLRDKITKIIKDLDVTYSRFRDDSLVTKLRTPGMYDFPDNAEKLVSFYRELYDVTNGSVTPLVGSTLEQAGYDATYSLQPSDAITPVQQWDDAMQWQGTKVIVKKPIVLDVGAAGKGYLVDIIADFLEANDIRVYTIDASGDIRQRGDSSERIGLENPYDSQRVLGVLELKDASLCASSSNRRQWAEDWHHVIDPRTGRPTRDVITSWVVAPSTMVADGLATALFFVDFNKLSRWDFQAVRLLADGRIEKTDNFVGELFV